MRDAGGNRQHPYPIAGFAAERRRQRRIDGDEGDIIAGSVQDLPQLGLGVRQSGKLPICAVHHMPGDHQNEPCDNITQVLVVIVGKGRQYAERHAG